MKKLAIIGASYLQLPLVSKAKEMGIETHCFAWEEGAVCKGIADYFYPISIRDKEHILQVCQQIGINGITSIASDVAIPTVSYIAEKLRLFANDYKDALVVTDKYLMRKRFADISIALPKFVFANEDYTTKNFRLPLIVKPTDRSGSRGVIKVSSRKDLDEAVERAKKESFIHNAIIEEFISGKEVSVESISWHGKHYILAITDKVTTEAPYFVELEHHQPCELPACIQTRLKKETLKVLNALNIKYGASHSEFKVTNRGKVFVIEVGARMGGDFIGSDLVQLSTGYDYLKGVIDIAFGVFDEPKFNEQKCSGVYFLCKETKQILPIIQNAENRKEILQAKITDQEMHNVQCSADRSGYFIYQSKKRFFL